MRGILGRAGKTSWKEELRTAGVFPKSAICPSQCSELPSQCSEYAVTNYKVIHRRGARSTCKRSSSISSDLDMLVVSTLRNSKYFTRMLVESRDTTCLLLAELFEELHSVPGVGICNKSICPRTAGVRPRPASSWCSWTARARPRPASSCCSWPFQLVRAAAASLRCCSFLSLLLSATILLRPIFK